MRSTFITSLLACAAHLTTQGEGILVQWTAPQDTSITGYRLHIGTASRQYSVHSDVGQTTAWTISNLTPGQQYFMAVSALNAYEEGGYSEEVIYTAPWNQAPTLVEISGQAWGAERHGAELISDDPSEDSSHSWTVIGAASLALAPDGSLALAFGAASPETAVAYHALKTIPGQKYELAFDVVTDVASPGTHELQMTLQSPALSIQKNFAISSVSESSGIRTETLTFTAANERTVLAFQGLSTSGPAANFVLDNIRVTELLAEGPVFTATPGEQMQLDLLATDPESSSSELSYSLVTPVAGAAIDASGVFTWTPSLGETGTHEFIIEVADPGNQASQPARDRKSFTIVVNQENKAPVAKGDSVNAIPDGTSRVEVAFLLRNDYDEDGDELRLESVNAVSQRGGHAIVQGDHVFYTPPQGFQGQDQLHYIITDGHTLTSGKIFINVKADDKPAIDPIKVSRLPSGEAEVQFEADPNVKYALEASTDSQTWARLGFLTSKKTGKVTFIDKEAWRFTVRYYRLTLP